MSWLDALAVAGVLYAIVLRIIAERARGIATYEIWLATRTLSIGPEGYKLGDFRFPDALWHDGGLAYKRGVIAAMHAETKRLHEENLMLQGEMKAYREIREDLKSNLKNALPWRPFDGKDYWQ